MQTRLKTTSLILLVALATVLFPLVAIPLVKAYSYNLEFEWGESRGGKTNIENEHPSSNTSSSALGFTFTTDADGFTLGYFQAYLAKVGSPTSDLVGVLYAEASDKPTGNPLVYSDNLLDSSTLPTHTTYTWATFNFTNSNYELSASTTYCLVVEVNTSNVDSANYVAWGISSTVSADYGRFKYASSAWATLITTWEFLFKVYRRNPNTNSLDSPDDSSTSTSFAVNFNFTPTVYDGTIQNASLHVNETSWATNNWNTSVVVNASSNQIAYTFSNEGTFIWNVEVFNSTTQSFWATANNTVTIDTPPRWQNQGSNASAISPGNSIELYAQGYDGIGLDRAWLWTNETGGTGKNYTEDVYQAELDAMIWLMDKARSQLVNASFPYSYQHNETASVNSTIAFPDLIAGATYYDFYQNQTWLDNANEVAEYLNDTEVKRLFYPYNTTLNAWITDPSYEIDGFQMDWWRPRMLIALANLARHNTTWNSLLQEASDYILTTHFNSTSDLAYNEVAYDGTIEDSLVSVDRHFYLTSALAYSGYVLDNSTLKTRALDFAINWKFSALELPYHRLNQTRDVETSVVFEDATAGAILNGMCAVYYYTGETNTTLKDQINSTAWAITQYCWNSEEGHFQYRTNPNDGSSDGTYAIHGFGLLDEGLIQAYLIWENTTWLTRARADFDWCVLQGSDSGILNNDLIRHASTSYYDATLHWNCYGIRAPMVFYSLNYSGIYLNTSYSGIYNTLYNTTATYHQKDVGWAMGIDSQNPPVISSRYSCYRFTAPLTYFSYVFADRENHTVAINSLGDLFGNFGIAFLHTSNLSLTSVDRTFYQVDLGGAADSWTWSNFTWTNSSITSGTTIQWRIYYQDTYGNINGTSVLSFTVSSEYSFSVGATVNVVSSLSSGKEKGAALSSVFMLTSSSTRQLEVSREVFESHMVLSSLELSLEKGLSLSELISLVASSSFGKEKGFSFNQAIFPFSSLELSKELLFRQFERVVLFAASVFSSELQALESFFSLFSNVGVFDSLVESKGLAFLLGGSVMQLASVNMVLETSLNLFFTLIGNFAFWAGVASVGGTVVAVPLSDGELIMISFGLVMPWIVMLLGLSRRKKPDSS